MRRLSLGLTAGVLMMALGSLVLVGCGGPVDQETDQVVRGGKKKKGGVSASVGGAAAKELPVKKEDYKGVISGQVKWEGGKPDFDALTQKLQAGMSNDRDYCLTGKKGDTQTEIMPYETFQQSYRIGDNNCLGNVFVWITPPSGFVFAPPDDVLPTAKSVKLHQPHCAFLPHCNVLVPSRDGKKIQTLVILNDARVGHNAKVEGGPLNGTRDQLLGAWDGSSSVKSAEYDLKPERDAVKISCGIHGWMRGFVRVFDHPFAAVTSVGAKLADARKPVWEDPRDPKYGSYEIKGVPVGAKVKLFAWHEELGFLTPPTGQEITVGEKNEHNFTAKLK